MPFIGWDHISLPTADPEATLAFYKKLGFGTIDEEEWRAGKSKIFSIAIGPDAKLNFHGPKLWQDPSFEAKGPAAKPGCGDVCVRFDGTLDEAITLIRDAGVEIVYGPYDQPGGAGGGRREGTSVYTRDPDGNLVEFITYPAAGVGRWGEQRSTDA
jgi:catechol 2,3-dioxygenase-like lactoylglutathione lyase family enzyme